MSSVLLMHSLCTGLESNHCLSHQCLNGLGNASRMVCMSFGQGATPGHLELFMNLSCSFLWLRSSGASKRKVKRNSQGEMLGFNQNVQSLQVLLDLREVVGFVLERNKPGDPR